MHGLRRAGGRPLRRLYLLRHVVPGNDASARRDGCGSDPASDDDEHDRPRGRAHGRARERGDVPVLFLRREQCGRAARLRTFAHPRPGRRRDPPGGYRPRDHAGTGRLRARAPQPYTRLARTGSTREELPRYADTLPVLRLTNVPLPSVVGRARDAEADAEPLTVVLPPHARVVIVGGGIIGTSIAYHLTKLGWSDVVLLERGTLTCGTTWHAAGLVMQLRASATLTKLDRYGAELYAKLEQETGQATGFKRCGSLPVARTADRFHEIKRMASIGHGFGVELEILTPAEIAKRHPLIDARRVVGGLFIPGDGQTNPVDTTMALAKGARARGAQLIERVTVTGIETARAAVHGVHTTHGRVGCDHVVNCAGIWAREIGRMAGVNVPLYASEHMYVTTTAMPALPTNLPVIRDTDGYVYIKEDAGKLLVGAFEPEGKPLPLSSLPAQFEFGELDADWDHFALPMRKAIELVPALESAQIRHFMNGPESFTPDNAFIVGEAPELRNFYVAAGFNSQGILSGAGIGLALAEWIVEGRPTMDLSALDIARFQRFQGNETYLRTRIKESLGLLYAMHWPHRQLESARPARRTPLHARLEAENACFGETAGWERANFYALDGTPPVYDYSYGRPRWFSSVQREHRAVRERVGLFDLSSFAKFRVEGPDAAAELNRICCNDVAVEPGRCVYTGMLNTRGGFEADLTVTRLSEDVY